MKAIQFLRALLAIAQEYRIPLVTTIALGCLYKACMTDFNNIFWIMGWCFFASRMMGYDRRGK